MLSLEKRRNSVKKKAWRFQKGTLVHCRYIHGSEAGNIDEKRLYRIIKIGPKEATIRQVNQQTMEEHQRGFVMRLFEQQEAERRNNAERGQTWRQFYPFTWSQLFVGVGESGWDPDCNF